MLCGAIRGVKILQKLETEHPAEADRHIRVTAEVKIDLESISQHSHPRIQGQRVGGVEHRIRHAPQRVGQQGLFRKSQDEDADAGGKAFDRLVPRGELCRQGLVTDDRPRHQVWKQRHEGREVGERFRGRWPGRGRDPGCRLASERYKRRCQSAAPPGARGTARGRPPRAIG